jgi:biotin carboxyl carrier protein
MPQEPSIPDLAARVRRLAEFLASEHVLSVRIERAGDEIELRRRPQSVSASEFDQDAPIAVESSEPSLEAIKAGYVGIFRLGRPAPVEGELLDGDRELGYIEQLGIRNVIHSLGAGRIVTIASGDGSAVEYGQPLFLVDRG